MPSKWVNDEQNNCSTQLPFVMTAYCTSIDHSTGNVHHFLVNGQEICLPIDFMYRSPNDHLPSCTNEFVCALNLPSRRPANQPAQLSSKTTRRNAMHNRKNVLCHETPSTKKDKRYYSTPHLYQLVNLQSFSVHLRVHTSSYRTSRNVTYSIEDPLTNNQQVVHYDRLKPFKEPPPTSKVPTKATSATAQSPTQDQETN